MHIDKKHFLIYTGHSIYEYIPKLYLDFNIHKPNLGYYYKSNYSFHVNFGFFNNFLNIELKWGFVEREMNEREKERKKRNKKFIEAVDKYEKEK